MKKVTYDKTKDRKKRSKKPLIQLIAEAVNPRIEAVRKYEKNLIEGGMSELDAMKKAFREAIDTDFFKVKKK